MGRFNKMAIRVTVRRPNLTEDEKKIRYQEIVKAMRIAFEEEINDQKTVNQGNEP